MATQEFYIRTASETEAHGPFTQEQLVSLAEAGKVDPQTLYYEANTEQWVSIGSNHELKQLIFPEKKRLTIKGKEKIPTLNEGPDPPPPLVVTDMLAAAEGRTSETSGKRDNIVLLQRATKIARFSIIALLIISAVSLLLPSVDLIASFNLPKLALVPFVYIGAFDVLLTISLLLGVVTIYPVIRFRSMLALGFLGLIFWSQGQIVPLFAVMAGSLGIYLTTIFVSYVGLGLSVGLGLAGMLGFAYYMLT